MSSTPRTRSRRYWIGVVLFVLVLLSVQAGMGYGIDWFKERWGDDALSAVAYVIAAAGALAALLVGARVWARCSAIERAWIAAGLLVYGIGTMTARHPQERLHYLGYGLLAALLYFGFARHRGGTDDETAPGGGAPGEHGQMLRATLLALLAGSAIGYADELLQILWPRRYFDWVDVGMNAVAVGLGLLVAVPVERALRRPS